MSRLLLSEENTFLYFCSSCWNYCACASNWFFTVQRWIKEVRCLEVVRKVQRGPKGSLTPFQRVSQSLDAKQPRL